MGKIILILFLAVSVWANIGTIMTIKGKAELNRSNKVILAANGMKLLKGDELVTKSRSRVQVMLKDDTIVTIGANSSFKFENFNFDGTENSEVSMRAKRGFFRSVTGKIGKVAPERFKVRTVSATIGIRGTDFSGDIGLNHEYIKCYSGTIFVEYEGGLEDIDAGMMIELKDGVANVREITEVKESVKNKPKTESMADDKDEKKFDVITDDIVDIKKDVILKNALEEPTVESLDRKEEY